jgi:hypothetical protein
VVSGGCPEVWRPVAVFVEAITFPCYGLVAFYSKWGLNQAVSNPNLACPLAPAVLKVTFLGLALKHVSPSSSLSPLKIRGGGSESQSESREGTQSMRCAPGQCACVCTPLGKCALVHMCMQTCLRVCIHVCVSVYVLAEAELGAGRGHTLTFSLVRQMSFWKLNPH